MIILNHFQLKEKNLEKEMPIPEAPYSDLFELGFFNYKKAQLTIIWKNKISRNEQIILLKKLYPELRVLSSSQIYKMACKNEGRWKFAEMGWGDAVDLKNKADKLGLNIIIEEIK